MVNFFYGYIYQLDLGIIRGLSFVNEKALVELPKSTLILELIFLCAAFLLFVRFANFISRFSRHISLGIGCIGLVLLGNVWLQNIDEIKKSFAPLESVVVEKENSLDETIANYFTDNYEVFNFSKEKNILVLIFDEFAANMLADILNENPEIKKDLDGFVWYKNTVSTGNFTGHSINTMIAGPEYTISKINQRADDITIEELISKNFADLYNAIARYGEYRLSAPYHHGYAPFISRELWKRYIKEPVYAINAEQNVILRALLRESAKSSFNKFLFGLSLFKLSPFSLKRKIYNGGNWRFFVRTTNINRKKARYVLFENLSQNLSYNSQKPTFKYFWSDLTHGNFNINQDGKWITQEDIKQGFDQNSVIARKLTLKYAMKKVIELVQDFRNNNIYNQTKIIVASDHGGAEKDWNDWALYSLMMVKDFNSTGEFQVSDIPISNADIPAIIGTGVDPTGKFNTENNFGIDYTKQPDRDRILQYHIPIEYVEEREKKYPAGKIISIQGDPYDRNNWQVEDFE